MDDDLNDAAGRFAAGGHINEFKNAVDARLAARGRDGILEFWEKSSMVELEPLRPMTMERAQSFAWGTPTQKAIVMARSGLIPRRQG